MYLDGSIPVGENSQSIKERKNLYSQADVILNTKDKNPGTSYKDFKYLIKNKYF